MKNLKRLSVILLCLTLALSLFACGEEEVIPGGDTVCQEHVDADKNGKCDVCDAAVALEDEKDPTTDDPTTDDPTTDDPTTDDPTTDDPTTDDPTEDDPTEDDPTVDNPTTDDPTEDAPTVDNPTEDDTPSETEAYLAAIEEAIMSANTVKINGVIDAVVVAGPYENAEGPMIDPVTKLITMTTKINYETISAKTEAGGFNYKVVFSMVNPDGKAEQSESLYVIGDKVYIYSGRDNEYYENSLSDMSAGMNGSMAGLMGGFELPEVSEEDVLMLKQLIVAAFEETFVVDENGNLVFTAELAPTINETLDELKAIDYEKQTIGETINKILAGEGVQFTIEQILDESVAYGANTVEELIDSINAVLVENTGMNDKELIATVIEQAGGADAIIEKIAPMLEMYGMTADSVKGIIEVLSTDGIKALLSPDMLALTVDQLVDMLMMSVTAEMPETEREEVSLAELVEMIKVNILPTPLVMVVGEDTVAIIKNTEVNELGSKVTLDIGENFAFEGMDITFGFDFKTPTITYNDEKLTLIDESMDLDITLSLELDDALTEIKLPEDAVIVDNGPVSGPADDDKTFEYSELNGTYGLNHIVVENISSGEERTYNLGDTYYGMLLTSDNISVTLKDGVGVMSYSFEQSFATKIEYDVVDDMFIMVCEDSVDLFNNGDSQNVFYLDIEEIDGKTCFVLTAVNTYSIFSHYVIEQ